MDQTTATFYGFLDSRYLRITHEHKCHTIPDGLPDKRNLSPASIRLDVIRHHVPSSPAQSCVHDILKRIAFPSRFGLLVQVPAHEPPNRATPIALLLIRR